MTFDIDQAMSERFAKTGDAFFNKMTPDKGAGPLVSNYDLARDPMSNDRESYIDGSRSPIDQFMEKKRLDNGLGPWSTPMGREEATKARGVSPAGSQGADLEEKKAEDAYAKQLKKKVGRSKRDLDTAVTEVATGENSAYNALPPGRSVEAFIDQVIGHMQAGMSFEDAINTAAESMTGRPLKKSFDINARMGQWDAANKAQHTEETERILKGGDPKVNFIGRTDYAKLKAMLADLYELSGGDIRKLRQVLEMAIDEDGFSPDPDLMTIAMLSQENKKDAAAINSPAASPIDPTGLEGYIGHMEDAKNPNVAMNRIGADKPRSKFIGEGGYDEFTTGPEDQTEIRGRELYGLPNNYGGLSARAEKGKEMAEDSSGDFEGE